MARGTRLFQSTGSPLIQGRSRQVRPFWQPYVVAVILGMLWPVASSLPHEIAAAGRGHLGGAVSSSLSAWVGGMVLLVPSMLVGAAIGVALGGFWGTRFRWVPGAVAGVGMWYALLVLVGLFG